MHTCISLIEEPWVVRGWLRGLKGVTCFRAPNADRSRVCVVVRAMVSMQSLYGNFAPETLHFLLWPFFYTYDKSMFLFPIIHGLFFV